MVFLDTGKIIGALCLGVCEFLNLQKYTDQKYDFRKLEIGLEHTLQSRYLPSYLYIT